MLFAILNVNKKNSITNDGRKLISEIFPKHLENINEIFSNLTLEEKKNLISLLKKLSGV